MEKRKSYDTIEFIHESTSCEQMENEIHEIYGFQEIIIC